DDAAKDPDGSSTLTLSVPITPITVHSSEISDSSAACAVNDSGLTVTVGLTNGGNLLVDSSGGQGGTTVSIGGTLNNSNYVAIGNGSLSAATTVTAASLSNAGGATLNITGSATKQALLRIQGAAGFGMAGVLTGHINL